MVQALEVYAKRNGGLQVSGKYLLGGQSRGDENLLFGSYSDLVCFILTIGAIAHESELTLRGKDLLLSRTVHSH